MSTLTSTLAIRVDDAGFAAKLRADAESARQLGINTQQVQKLRANAGTAGLVKQLDRLNATAGQVTGYQNATRALQTLGAGHRAARVEVERTATALAHAQKRVDFFNRSRASNSPNYAHFQGSGLVAEANAALRKAARQHTAARRTFERTQEALQAQKTSVRALGSELERAGHPLNQIAQVQAGLRAKVEQTTQAIRRQATAHEEARVAAAASAAETTRRANAGLRAAVQGGAAARREREAVVAAQRAEAGRRATAQLRATVQGAEQTRSERRAAAREAAAQARRDNKEALRRTVQAGEQAREDREERQAHEAARRRNAGRDMAAGMGAAGRRQSADIEGGRRLTEGMSEPARKARERAAAEAEVAEITAREARAQAKADQAQARKALLGIGGLALGHKVHQGTEATLHTYREFDSERRFGGVVMDLSDEQQKPLVDQAIHLGATSKYNDVKVLEAQRELAARGLTRDQVLGMIPAAKDLGQATSLGIPEAVKQLEGGIFGFKKDISSVEAAARSARQTADVQVTAAKASGMTPDDIRQAYTYGATPARLAGVSEHKMLAFAAIGKKSNMDGAQMGTAWRALISNATAPTRKAKETLRANGLNYSDYQKSPEKLDLDAFTGNVASSYGVRLNGEARKKLGAIFTDKDLIKDASRFTPAVMDALGESLGKKDAKSKQSIAGMANRFRDASMQGVDVDRLIGDMLRKIPGNIAFSNAMFGSKQGARIASAYGDPEAYQHILDALEKHAEGRASKVSEARMQGYDGAVSRLEGSKKNLETSVGRSLDNNGEGSGGFLTSVTNAAATFTQALAELPNPILAAGASIAWLGGKVAETTGTALLIGASTGVATGVATGKGAAIAAGAAAAGTAGVGLGTLGIGMVAANIAAKQMPKVIDERGAAAYDAATGFTPDANPMEGMAPSKPWATEWLKRRLPSVFGDRDGSLPPGMAGMPQAPLPRLPGLDGRPKAAPARQGDEAMMTSRAPMTLPAPPAAPAIAAMPPSIPAPSTSEGEGALAQLHARADEVRASVQAIGNQPVAPQVDTSRIEAVAPKAAEAKTAVETLNLTATPNVDVSSIDAAMARVRALKAEIASLGASIAGVAAQARSMPSPGGQLRGRTSPSFSDGVTPGAGVE